MGGGVWVGGSSAGWGGLKLWTPRTSLIIPRVSWVGLLPHLLSLVTGALSGCLLVPLSALSLCRWQVCRWQFFRWGTFFFKTSETCGPFGVQNYQSWFVAQLSRYMTAVPVIPGSNSGIVQFLVCHPLGLPNTGERLGFNLVHKKCSPQIYKRGGGFGGGQKLGGWVQSWVGGFCPKYPPPSYKRSLVPNDGCWHASGVVLWATTACKRLFLIRGTLCAGASGTILSTKSHALLESQPGGPVSSTPGD